MPWWWDNVRYRLLFERSGLEGLQEGLWLASPLENLSECGRWRVPPCSERDFVLAPRAAWRKDRPRFSGLLSQPPGCFLPGTRLRGRMERACMGISKDSSGVLRRNHLGRLGDSVGKCLPWTQVLILDPSTQGSSPRFGSHLSRECAFPTSSPHRLPAFGLSSSLSDKQKSLGGGEEGAVFRSVAASSWKLSQE